MEKRIFLEGSYNKISISKDKLSIRDMNHRFDERYTLLYSFINEYESFKNLPFFKSVLDLLYTYFPTWSLEECKISLNYIEKIIKENKHWQHFFLNQEHKFIDLFFNELQK